MPTTPNDFLAAAQTALNAGGEANYGAAVNRAYYAAYHTLEPYGRFMEYNGPEKAGIHKKLVRKFLIHPDLKVRQIGFIIQVMRDLRIKADYKLSETITKADAETQIQQAKNIIQHAQALDQTGS